MGLILVWLHRHNVSNDRGTLLDHAHLSAYLEKLGGFCAANPGKGFATAAKAVFGE